MEQLEAATAQVELTLCRVNIKPKITDKAVDVETAILIRSSNYLKENQRFCFFAGGHVKSPYFEHTEIQNIQFVRFLRSIDAGAEKDMKLAVKDWQQGGAKLFVFDFKAVEKVDPSIYRLLIEFGKFLLRHKKAATAVNLHGHVENEIMKTTLHVVLKPIKDIQEAKQYDVPNNLPENTTFVQAFVAAAKETFADYFKTPIMDAHVAYDWTPALSAVDIGIASYVKSMDPALYPSVLLGLPLNTFINVYENMFGDRISKVTEEEADTIIELLNMLFGKVKGLINAETGQKFEIQVPEFADYKKLLETHKLGQSRNSFIEYTSPAGPFFVILISDDKVAAKSAA